MTYIPGSKSGNKMRKKINVKGRRKIIRKEVYMFLSKRDTCGG